MQGQKKLEVKEVSFLFFNFFVGGGGGNIYISVWSNFSRISGPTQPSGLLSLAKQISMKRSQQVFSHDEVFP